MSESPAGSAPPPADAKTPAEGPRAFSRRDLLRVAATSAMAVGTVGAGLLLLDRDPAARPKALLKIKDHKLARAPGTPAMAIARGPDAATNVRRAIEALGGMGAFVRAGEKVVIKPNVGWNRLADQAANTNPEIVAELVRMAVAAGASVVWVTDNPVNNAERCFERSGIRKAVGEAGGRLVMPEANHFRDVEVGGKLLRVAEVLFPLVEADRVINVPIVKQHSLSGATLSMKNWYGVLGGHRVRLHQDIHRSIVDLALMVKPTLTVLDATRVLLANGPSGGSLDDVKQLDTLAASTDEVALDAFGAGLLGLKPDAVGFIGEGERAGLGVADYRSLKLVEIPA
jgi:uncharacterized protein (DUF362 family)